MMIYLYLLIFQTIALCFYYDQYFKNEFMENGWLESHDETNSLAKVGFITPKNQLSLKWLKIQRLNKKRVCRKLVGKSRFDGAQKTNFLKNVLKI